MRLVTYLHAEQERLGAWIDDDRQVIDLALASELIDGKPSPAFSSMQALIDSGPEHWDRARSMVEGPPDDALRPSRGLKLLAPLPRPIQIRDCLCFPAHLEGGARVSGERLIKAAADPEKKRAELEAAGHFELSPAYYERPVYYLSNRLTVVGTDVDVIWPPYSTFIDYELEWAAVLGKSGRAISKSKAREHIFGYTIFNDWSARDEQMKVMGGALNIGPGQGKDFANGFGPCLVTADEFSDPYSLTMIARINGTEVSRSNTSGMYFKYEDLIEHFSRGHDLFAGEVIGSGTVGGGCTLENGLTVNPGDEIELEVEGIGVLRNRVLAPHISADRGERMPDNMADSMANLTRR